MEINFDKKPGYNCDVLWGKNSTVQNTVNYQKHNYGYDGMDHRGTDTNELQPLAFFNSYLIPDQTIDYDTFLKSVWTVSAEDKSAIIPILEIHTAKDDLWMHGNSWISPNIMFPQDIAHPTIEDTGRYPRYGTLIDRNIYVGKPSLLPFTAQFKRGRDTFTVLKEVYYTGALSLANFFRNSRINAEINLYDFEPWPLFADTTLSRLPGYSRGFKWMNDTSGMFGDNGSYYYNFPVDLPPFIEDAHNMFINSVASTARFNFSINGDIIRMADAESTPVFLNTHGMFRSSDFWNYPEVWNSARWLRTRITDASCMFYSASNFNQSMHIYSRTVTNTSNMFAFCSKFNELVELYDGEHAVFEDYLSTHKADFSQINDASNMFRSCTVYNYNFMYPVNGINNASCMFLDCRTFDRFIAPVGQDTSQNYLGVRTYIDDTGYAHTTSDINVQNAVFIPGQAVEDDIPFRTNDSSYMFLNCWDLDKDIIIGENTCINAYAMFRNCFKLKRNIYVGPNSALNAWYMFETRSIIGDDVTGSQPYYPDGGWVLFDDYSLSGDMARFVFSSVVGINVDTFCFGNYAGNMTEEFFWGTGSAMKINIGTLMFRPYSFHNGIYTFFGRGMARVWNESSWCYINTIWIDESVAGCMPNEYGGNAYYSAASAFANMLMHSNYLHIGQSSCRHAAGMFYNDYMTEFNQGINIHETACINADDMFYNCTNIKFGGSVRMFAQSDLSWRRTMNHTFQNCNMQGYSFHMNGIYIANRMFENAKMVAFDNDNTITHCPNIHSAFIGASFVPDTVHLEAWTNAEYNHIDARYAFRDSRGIRNLYINDPNTWCGYAIANSDIMNLFTASSDFSAHGDQGARLLSDKNDMRIYAINGAVAHEIQRWDYIRGSDNVIVDLCMRTGYWVGYDGEGQEIWNQYGTYNRTYSGPQGEMWYTPNGQGEIHNDNKLYFNTQYNINLYGEYPQQ